MAVFHVVILLCLTISSSLGEKFVCPGDGSYPHPTDCSKFYLCGGSTATVMKCPDNTLFDPVLRVCNIASQVNCNTATSTTAAPTTTTRTTTPTPTTSTRAPTTQKPPVTPAPGKCPALGQHYYPIPEDCTSFLACVNGNQALNNCPEGYGFNPATKDCSPGAEINCNAGPLPTPPSQQIQCPAQGVHLKPNPDEVYSFYVCFNGRLDLITCPVDYKFSESAGTCVTVNEVVPPPVDCSTVANGALIADPTDCSMFYICSNGAAVRNKCPPGLLFNPVVSSCDKPNNVQCPTKAH